MRPAELLKDAGWLLLIIMLLPLGLFVAVLVVAGIFGLRLYWWATGDTARMKVLS